MSKPRHPIVRAIRNVAGFALVLLGIVGLFLPILQGILFFVIGLGLIDVPQKHRLHVWLRTRSKVYRRLALSYKRTLRRIRLRRARSRAARLGAEGCDPQGAA